LSLPCDRRYFLANRLDSFYLFDVQGNCRSDFDSLWFLNFGRRAECRLSRRMGHRQGKAVRAWIGRQQTAQNGCWIFKAVAQYNQKTINLERKHISKTICMTS
jgi:hypothetical protein